MEMAALSSAEVEFASVTLETSLIRFSTETIISDCWALANAISSISTLIDWMHTLMTCIAEIVRFVDSVPVSTSSVERPINALMMDALDSTAPVGW